MSFWSILLRNLLYFRKQHAGACLGPPCARWFCGSSYGGRFGPGNLSALADERIGQADLALLAPDGFFREELSDEIQEELGGQRVVAPIVITREPFLLQMVRYGSITSSSRSGGTLLELGARPGEGSYLEEDGFLANPRLYKHLKVADGARIILRVEEPGLFSRDAPLSGERDDKFVSFNENFWERSSRGIRELWPAGQPKRTSHPFRADAHSAEKMFRSFDEETEAPNSQTSFFLKPRRGPDWLPRARKALNEKWTLEDADILQNSSIRPIGACGLGRYSFPTPYGMPSSKSIRRHKACSLIWSMRLNETSGGRQWLQLDSLFHGLGSPT